MSRSHSTSVPTTVVGLIRKVAPRGNPIFYFSHTLTQSSGVRVVVKKELLREGDWALDPAS